MRQSATQPTVVATQNRAKLAELQCLLPSFLKLSDLSEYSAQQVVESAPSFVENALLKARNASTIAQLPAIADDSGLCVAALNNAPELYSARYSQTDFEQMDSQLSMADNNNSKLLAAMAGIEQREAFFYCALVYVSDQFDARPLIATASWHGSIVQCEPRGDNGFGYDSLFEVDNCYRDGLPCTAAQLSDAEKARLSHRAQAAAKLAPLLVDKYA